MYDYDSSVLNIIFFVFSIQHHRLRVSISQGAHTPRGRTQATEEKQEAQSEPGDAKAVGPDAGGYTKGMTGYYKDGSQTGRSNDYRYRQNENRGANRSSSI